MSSYAQRDGPIGGAAGDRQVSRRARPGVLGALVVCALVGCSAHEVAPMPPAAPASAAPPAGVSNPEPVSVASLPSSPPTSRAGWHRYLTELEFAASASSEYYQYPPSAVLDRDPSTSWFSSVGDSVSRGKSPWIQVAMSRPVRLRRVVVMGNRSRSFPVGYSVLKAQLRVLDAQAQEITRLDAVATGPARDFEFTPPRPLDGVQAVRLDVLGDEGDRNSYGDVAIGEIKVDAEDEPEDLAGR